MRLTFNGRRLPVPEPGSPDVDTRQRCQCGETRVRGVDPVTGRDTITSRAVCCQCGGERGQLVVHVETLFGIEEDRAVLVHGRARVYR